MIGLVRTTTSPSSSSMSRSTPWVEGCWGPMLMIIVSSSPRSMSIWPASFPSDSGSRRTALRASRNVSWVPPALRRGFLELHGNPPHAVVLAQGVALPVVGHEDPGEIGVPGKADAHQVEDLALHRIGARIEVEKGRDDRVGLGYLHPEADAAPGRERQEVHDDLEALGGDPVGQRPAGMTEIVNSAEVRTQLAATGPLVGHRAVVVGAGGEEDLGRARGRHLGVATRTASGTSGTHPGPCSAGSTSG